MQKPKDSLASFEVAQRRMFHAANLEYPEPNNSDARQSNIPLSVSARQDQHYLYYLCIGMLADERQNVN